MTGLAHYTEVFSALADPTRLEMVRMLTLAEEVACTTFDKTFDVSKPTISYHVRILRQAGLIRVRKEGPFFHYTLVRDAFNRCLPGFLAALQEGSREQGETRTTGDRRRETAGGAPRPGRRGNRPR